MSWRDFTPSVTAAARQFVVFLLAGKKRIPTFLIPHLIECSMNKEMSVYSVTEIILLASSGYVSRVQYILWLTETVKSRSLQSFTKCWRMKRRFQLSVSFLDYSPSSIAGRSILPSVCFYHYSFVLRPERKKEGRGLSRDEHFFTIDFQQSSVCFAYSV
jgi:hypothetical protein